MPGTVLIVEDEPALAGLLGDALEAAGYQAVLTTAGRALGRYTDIRPVAVVIDYLMPGLNGAQVVRQIRDSLPTHPPVILVTGLSNARELANEIGADAYLRKPFDVAAFVGLVDRLATPADG